MSVSQPNSSALPASLGLWIRQRRRMLDLTQEALAAAAGLSVSAIRKIEADERHPSLSVAESLAAALQIPAAQRGLFLRVARQETRVDQLRTIGEPVVQPLRAESTAGTLLPPHPDPAGAGQDTASEVLRAATAAGADVENKAAESLLGGRLTALPTFPTALVGREVEIGQIRATLLNPDCRLLSLTGAGGIGKTRLGVAAASQLAEAFADGAIFVALAAVEAGEKPNEQSAPAIVGASDPLASALANVLRLRSHDPEALLARVVAYLADKVMLIVLDNLEHLLDSGVAVVSAVLEGAPGIKILATTREQLNLQSEWVFNVRGLAAPVVTSQVLANAGAEGWQSASAVRLFVQSARRALVGFEPSAEELVAIAEICRLVDGIPLAVELAASWVRVLTCSEIAAEIAHDWTFLSGATRDMPERHRSMRAVFDHSWRFLTPSEQRLLRHLSVFRGGFRRDAAQAVAGATLQDLAGLVAKSLVNGQGSSQSYGQSADRYEIHELVRHFAGEELAKAGETRSARDRHAAWYIELATSSEDALHGSQQVQWLQRLDADLQNFEGALRWITGGESTIQPGEGWRMISALWWFCFVRGYWSDLYNWLMHFYRLNPPVDTAVRAIAIGRTGNLAWLRGETQLAERLVAEAYDAALQSGNEIAVAMSWYAIGQVYSQGEPARSLAAYRESLAITRRNGRRWGEGRSLFRVGTGIMDTDDLEGALVYFREALDIFRQLGDLWGIYAVLSDTVDIYLRQAKPELAATAGHEALGHARALGFRQGIALEVLSLGIGAWHQGHHDEAGDWFEEASRLFTEIDNQRGVAQVELQFGHLALLEGDLGAARRHYESGDSIMRGLGTELTRAVALDGLAQIACRQGDLAAASVRLREAIISQMKVPALRHALPSMIETGAHIAAQAGEWAFAAQLIAAAEVGRIRYANALPPILREGYRDLVESVRGTLGERYAHAYAAGAGLSESEIVAQLAG